MFDLDIFFKLELMQKTGSFKSRGAINKVLQLSEEERSRGVVAISAGNHAQATSWACSQFGIKSKIIMPHTASQSKICLLYTSPSPRDQRGSRMPSSA